MIDVISAATVDLRKCRNDSIGYNHKAVLKEILDYYDENNNNEDDFIFTITRLLKSDLGRLRDDILIKRSLLFCVDMDDINTTKDIITVHIYKL